MNFRHFAAALILACSAVPALAASPSDLGVIGSIKMADGRWDYASIDPASRTLYVARGDGVMAVDLASNRVTPELVPGQHVHSVVVLPGKRLLSTNGDSNTATISDAMTGHVIADVPAGKGPDAAVFDPSSGLVFVIDGDVGVVTPIDPVTGAARASIPVGGSLEFAVADGVGHVFINIESAGGIAVLDTKSRRVVARYTLPGCEHPTGLAIDPASGVLLSACANGHAVAVRAKDGSVVATLPIGRGPDAVIFDPAQHVFFVPCGKDGTLVAIREDANALSVAATIPTAPGARTGALDPQTGNIYLPAGGVSRDSAGFHIKPGSVRIVVVGAKA